MLDRPHVLPPGAITGDGELELPHQPVMFRVDRIRCHLMPRHVRLYEQSKFHPRPLLQGRKRGQGEPRIHRISQQLV